MSTPAANLRRLMVQHGLTVAQVAEQCGLDERTIRGILDGSNRPHARTLHKLAAGLGVSADVLGHLRVPLIGTTVPAWPKPAICESVITSFWRPYFYSGLRARFWPSVINTT